MNPAGIVVYSDKNIIVINKPPGVLSYSSEDGNPSSVTTCKQLLERESSDNKNVYVVNRLDQGTSGLMVLARNKIAARHYSNLFKNRKVYKEYVALLHGSWELGHLTITSR